MTSAEPIRLAEPQLSEAAIEAAVAVLRSSWLGPGPIVTEFESALSDRFGGRHAVAVSSGTAALHLALLLVDLEPETEVVTTAVTFVATNQAIAQAGLVPVFADIDPTTGCVTAATIAEQFSERTGAVMVMHYAGQPCDLDEINALCAERGVPLVEDAAHAFGASYRGQPVGAGPGLAAFSFQATKNLCAVDGGVLIVSDAADAERARRLRWMGIDRSTFDRVSGGYSSHYEVVEAGFKYSMNDVTAAIALAELGELDANNRRRAEIVAAYREGLRDCPRIELLGLAEDRVSSCHLAPILCEDPTVLRERLRSRNIETGHHYRRNDHFSVFRSQDLPGVASFVEREVSLPIHMGLKNADVDRVIDAVRSAQCSAP